MKNRCLLYFLTIFLFSQSFHISAAVVMLSTRVIYLSDQKDVSLAIYNHSSRPSLIQAWIESEPAQIGGEKEQIPFVLTPSVLRLAAGKQQKLSIMALPEANNLSQTQESIFWLHIVDIPPKPNHKIDSTQNYLQVIIHSRLKLIYRPKRLHDERNTAPQKLVWKIQDHKILIENPTAFYMSIPSVLTYNRQDLMGSVGMLIKPFSNTEIVLNSDHIEKLKFMCINDYGGYDEYKVELNRANK
ncbi:fimbrial biogenesis chaperone [Acinetobacter gerneri]|uniref:fimbrial biogenesis chaperone n=1 Tax=Acinetobacter gerneri TaxID=202952 RepID=UPI0023F305D3|nr:molecular chaperone [Acinetobacter gerneri]MCH4242977.1 molecular chaperone [Acinetobacter gerneri]